MRCVLLLIYFGLLRVASSLVPLYCHIQVEKCPSVVLCRELGCVELDQCPLVVIQHLRGVLCQRLGWDSMWDVHQINLIFTVPCLDQRVLNACLNVEKVYTPLAQEGAWITVKSVIDGECTLAVLVLWNWHYEELGISKLGR